MRTGWIFLSQSQSKAKIVISNAPPSSYSPTISTLTIQNLTLENVALMRFMKIHEATEIAIKKQIFY